MKNPSGGVEEDEYFAFGIVLFPVADPVCHSEGNPVLFFVTLFPHLIYVKPADHLQGFVQTTSETAL